MPQASPVAVPIQYSARFEPPDDCPLPAVELGQLVEDHLADAVRANVCVALDGGTKRTTIRPTITELGTSSVLEVIDALQAIAWAHVQSTGKPARYCAELWVLRDGMSRPKPERAYFNLEPDTLEPEAATVGTSFDYARALEQQNLRLVDRMQRQAERILQRDGQAQRLAYDSIAKLRDATLAVSQLEVDRIEADSKAKRKESLTGAVTRLLPQVARRFLREPAKPGGAPVAALEGGRPVERLRAFLDAETFEGMRRELGAERWAAVEAAASREEVKPLLVDLPDTTAEALLELVGLERLAEIAEWS